MKRLIFCLLLSASLWGQGSRMLLSVAATGGGTPSVLHSVIASTQNCWTGSPCAVTVPATTSGSSLVVFMHDQSGSAASIMSATASGATFSSPSGCTFSTFSPNPSSMQVFVAPNVPAGITTVNVGAAGAGAEDYAIIEVGGVLSSPVDVCAKAQTAETSTMSTASITTTVNNDFIVGFSSETFAANARTFTWNSPCTVVGTSASQTSVGSKTLVATATTSCPYGINATGGSQDSATLALKY